MIATVTLFYNTGFNPKNLPDTPALLNQMTSQTFDSNFELQNNEITNCFIDATWSEVKNADYLKLSNCYFFIISRTMVNENCAELHIQIDAVTSLGGAINLTYSGGIINRAHVGANDDTLFGNCVEEDIGPLQPIKIIVNGSIGTSGNDSVTLVGSTLSLTQPGVIETTGGKIEYTDPTYVPQAFTFKGSIGQDDYTITLAEPVPLPVESIITIDGDSNKISGVGLYDYTLTKANQRYLRMLNLDGAILYCYNMPTSFGGSTIITGVHGTGELNPTATGVDFTASGAPFVRSDYTARNNKVYAMYSTYRLSFDISSDEQIFNACDLYNGNTAPVITITADPQPNGYFIARPKIFQGLSDTPINFKSIHSLPWRNTPIAFNTEKGELIQNKDMKLAQNKLKDAYWSQYGNGGGIRQMLQGASQGSAGGWAGMLGGAVVGGGQHLGSVLTQGITGGKDLYNPLTEMEYNEAKRSLIVPDLTSNPALGLNNVKPERLRLMYLGPTADDLARFDNYFDMYGYAMAGTIFDKKYLNNRQYCNYIQVSDIHITSDTNDFGLSVKAEAERQLSNGVRIWHIKPTHLTSNPAV